MWVIINGYYFLVQPSLMHRRILKNELSRWYTVDVGLPLLPVFIITICARFLISQRASISTLGLELCIVLGISMLSAALLTPTTCTWIRASFKELLKRKTQINV